MGGRGSSSGRDDKYLYAVGGLKVDAPNGIKETYYFSRSDEGTNFYQTSLGTTPEETPLNMSMREFEKRMKNNGAKVERISRKEYIKTEREYWERERKKPDYQLGMGLEDNSQYRKTARLNRLADRIVKRPRGY